MIKKKFFKRKFIGFPFKRFLFLILILIIYRFGTYIPIPGVNIVVLKEIFSNFQNNSIGIFNIFSGLIISNFSIFSLGIMPYISSSIIIQLFSLISSKIFFLTQEGEIGQKKILKYTKYLSLFFAFIQSLIVSITLSFKKGVILHKNFFFYITLIFTLVTGSVILMWFSEQITEYGLGNGISIIVFSSIASGIPNVLKNFFSLLKLGNINLFSGIFIFFILILIIFIIVFFETAQRKIIINYIEAQKENIICYNQITYLPLKINMSGVIPIIFATSIISFPSIIVNWFALNGSKNFFIIFLKNISLILKPTKKIYIFLYILIVIFFSFFYNNILFNSKEVAENLKKNGAFIIGYRPGECTSNFINSILLRLTLFGSIYVSLISLLPQFFISYLKIPFYFGSTSLFVIVVVTIELIEQIQFFMISENYNSLLKK